MLRQQAGRRAGDEQLHPTAINEPTHHPLPSGHQLHLVEVQGEARCAVVGRVPERVELARMLVQQPRQVGGVCHCHKDTTCSICPLEKDS
jgi:hypothetical protein